MKQLRQADAYLIVISVVILIAGTRCAIRIKNIGVPLQVQTGDTVNLSCEVDLQQEKLYTLAWWKDDRNFFKYRPGASRNNMVVYKVPGINVDLDRSSKEQVVMTNVSLATSGVYKCELVAEPDFDQDYKSKNLTVVDIPDRTPILLTSGTYFSPGDILVANCTSPGSNPAPVLEWKINDDLTKRHQSQIISQELPYMSLYTRVSQLRFPLQEHHFKRGEILVTCSAVIKDFYLQASHVTVKRNGYRTAAPFQKHSGEAPALAAMFLLNLVSLWTHIPIHLIWTS